MDDNIKISTKVEILFPGSVPLTQVTIGNRVHLMQK